MRKKKIKKNPNVRYIRLYANEHLIKTITYSIKTKNKIEGSQWTYWDKVEDDALINLDQLSFLCLKSFDKP